MRQITDFNFQNNLIQIVDTENALWFVAKQCCDVLNITKYRDMLATLDPDQRASTVMDTPGGRQEVSLINESGLYELIFRSRSPAAKPFRKWVTGQVLPTLRKTGSYAITEHHIPQTRAEALRLAADLAEQLEQAEQRLVEQAPQVQFAEAIQTSDELMSVSEVAKLLQVGTNKLFQWLRHNPAKRPFLIRMGDARNEPADQYINAGHARVVATPWEQTHTNGRQTKRISRKTMITGSGLRLIQKWLTGVNL